MYTAAFCRLGTSIRTSIFVFVAILALGQTGLAQSVPATGGRTMPPVIVIGFLGGFVKHDNFVHSEVQLAARLRKAYPLGVDVETFESYRGEKARRKVLGLLDANHDGTLTSDEKQNARIIIYGHSWGGSEAIALARELKKDGIPVLLTVQVDSVSKIHQNDAVIPSNVAQLSISISRTALSKAGVRSSLPMRHARGSSEISNLTIERVPWSAANTPWCDRVFVKPHTQIECDPKVWSQAEALIRSNLPPATPSGSTP